MTRRGALTAAAALAVVAIGAANSGILAIGLMLFLVAVAAVVIDGRRTPNRKQITADRIVPDFLSIGVAQAVTLRVGVHPVGSWRALVRDETPPEFSVDDAPIQHVSIPGEVSYAVTSRVRGEFRFGNIVMRLIGPWGMGFRQVSVTIPTTVRVDPDLSAVQRYEALVRRGQLAELGVRAHRIAGQGTEFDRVREAVPDDPQRWVNWPATARTGQLMVTELTPERAQPVIMCIDHGRLTGVGANGMAKLDHAINAALLLAHVALRSGDRVGVVGFADTVTRVLTPRGGASQLHAFLSTVRELRAGEIESDYDNAFAFISRWQSRRALLAIFTDIADSDHGATLIRQCARIRRRHLPLVITLRDPAVDAAAEQPPVNVHSMYARAVAGGLLAERRTTLEVLQRSGIDTIDADARVLSPRVVNRYLELKRRMRL